MNDIYEEKKGKKTAGIAKLKKEDYQSISCGIHFCIYNYIRITAPVRNE